MLVNNKTADWLSNEWTYILNPKDDSITVLHGVRDKGEHDETGANGRYKVPNYHGINVGRYPIIGTSKNRIDWKRVEEKGEKLAQEWEKYAIGEISERPDGTRKVNIEKLYNNLKPIKEVEAEYDELRKRLKA